MELYDETPPDLPDVSKIGSLGWAALCAGVLAWDVFAGETLSAAAERGLQNKYTGPFIMATIGYVSCHLAGILPPQADVLKSFASRVRR